MATPHILPISASEFASMMRLAMPPTGWSNTLAVGNSGGPDSICLLFLLHRYLNDEAAKNTQPRRLVSLSIDHNLQASSSSMAAQAARIAGSLDIAHVTAKLPWGEGHHQQKPGPGDKIEEKARDMRQFVLFEHMKKLDTNALAFGHHADDQVETMLMRLGRGSNASGLAGMRPYRRWGMGSRTEGPNPYEIEGMRKWIVRPLLGVAKDRILATCEDQKLDYVTDPTNFQPQLTIRNAIRHVLQNGGISKLSAKCSSLSTLPSNIMKDLRGINDAASQYNFGLDTSLQDLRIIQNNVSTSRCRIDNAVDELLVKYRLPSVPGTFMVSPLSLCSIESEEVREAFLFRITRYVSPEPWGHPHAELGRRKTSVGRLSSHLCNVNSFPTKSNHSLCVGSGVWWRLATLSGFRLSFDTSKSNTENLSWIAVRQPPGKPDNSSLANETCKLFTRDVTERIAYCIELWLSQKDSPILQFLYDNRFLICIHLDRMPPQIMRSLASGNTKIIVESSKPWYIPQVIQKEEDSITIIHSQIIRDPFVQQLQLGSRGLPMEIHSDWITIQYFRPLSTT